MSKIKLHYPRALFFQNDRNSYFELLKSKLRFENKNSVLDAAIQAKIEWVHDAQLADAFVLPHDWNYYFKQRKERDAIDFCIEADKNRKRVLSSTGGDQGITVNVPENTIVYRQSGYSSKMRSNERTAPFFLSDPITVLLKKDEDKVIFETDTELPVIGFCGMAPHGLKVGLRESAQVIFRNVKSLLGISPFDTQEVLSSSNLRFRILKRFSQSVNFKKNYIIRNKYRGGEQTQENRKKTTYEYYQNQIESDLIICARGVGNFSVRFYETLAMGRIPIFIDTDSPLPDIGNKNWNDYLIWVDRNNIFKAPEIAAKWLEKKEMLSQKKKNRMLWLEHFRLDNFWINELNELEKKLHENK